MKAIQIHKTGNPDVMQLEDVPAPQPGQDEILVKIAAAGVNFIDIYQRAGGFPKPMPFIPGLEAAGTVEAVGSSVTEFKPGDRVAYATGEASYSQYALISAEKAVLVPKGIDLPTAAAVMLQGMTAHYLTHSTYPLNGDKTALIHAAAGGTGQLVVQMAKLLGATVIGTTSTEAKAEVARKAGADHVILYSQTDFAAETMHLTNGQGVNVVYDSVGQATFDQSLSVLRSRGCLALFGQATGPVPAFDLARLGWQGGSLFVTRPSLFHYILTRDELLWRANDVFKWLAEGKISLRIDRQLPLSAAAEAHRLLAGRQTTGKLLLIP